MTTTTAFSRRRALGFAGSAALTAGMLGRWPVAAQTTPATPTVQLDTDIAGLDAFIAEAMDRYAVPGAAVAVVYRGQPLLTKGYGVREVGSEVQVDANTIFQLASNTKPMTAFTLATLVDEGRIDWDTPITDVLPELELSDAYATRHLTLRDILSHRSGLPEFTGDLLGYLGYDRAELLRRLRHLEPGSSFREEAAYSNLGYFIAGEVIARLTGVPWEEAMRERLFEPLSMARSGPSLADLPDDGNVASPHARIDGEIIPIEPDDHGVHGAAGSAVSTANDLARWMQMLLAEGSYNRRQLVEPETVEEMVAPSMVAEVSFTEVPPIDEHAGFSYGLGWGVYHYQGYEVLEKGGGLAGVRTVLNLVPALDYGIAVLANLNLTFLPEAVRAYALESLLGEEESDTQTEIESRATIVDELFAAEPPPVDPVPPSVPLDAFAGTYVNPLYGEFEVIVDGDALRVEAGPADLSASLSHFNHDTFLMDWHRATSLPEETTFIIGPDGIPVAFENESLGRFDRVEDE